MTTTDPAIAMVFPGQGSQSVGMLAELAAEYDSVGSTFEQAGSVLGYDLWKLVQEGPEQTLNSTDHTQPAMLAAGVAVWRAWLASDGVHPALMAGHSLGEYTALVCAGSLDFEAAVALVAERGRLMQSAVPEGSGAMAAILGLDDETVKSVCADSAAGEVVTAVNFNSPGQVVIAGHSSAVERAIAAAKSAGAKRAVLLPVSVPSHCELMRPAAEHFAELLADTEIREPEFPVIQNVDAESHTRPDAIRENLARQLYSPVLWVQTVQVMQKHCVNRLLEMGPGKVLTGLGKRIDKSLAPTAIIDPASLKQTIIELS